MRAGRVVFWAAVLVLLLPAVLLTANRSADSTNGRLVRVESFTPLAMPLYAVVLVVALLTLVLRRGGRARRVSLVLVALVAVGGLAVHASWFSARLFGANPPAAAGAEPITVMTANLYAGRADGIELVRVASEEKVDVLVVEEITTRELVQMERAGLDALFPHRIGDAEKEYGVDGTMVFSRTPLGNAEPIATEHESWQVSLRLSGRDLTLLAVHPYSPTDPGQWWADHQAINDAALASDADLIVGDFNATLDHRPMRALSALGWRSVAELANEGWQPTWPANGVIRVLGLPVPALVQIDHVLIGSRLAALSTRTVGIPGTDHRAVIAEVAGK